MNTEQRIMRCHIEGSWTAKDMAESLIAFRTLYNLRLGLQIIAEDYRDMEEFYFELRHFPPFRRRLKGRRPHPLMMQTLLSSSFTLPTVNPEHIARLLLPQEELLVRRIEYASPGFKDLAGLGEIVGHIKDFTLRLIEHFSSRKSRNLNNEEHEIRNQSLRIQNARDFVALVKECGYDESEVRQIVNGVDDTQDSLIRLISNGKLQNVQMLDEPDQKPD
ncbi:MAG: hypothetical protein KDA16_07820 [Phycisphaerales bacterium]|nr:hypothetical protein [Phycisphaerales bacterium]